MVIEIILSSLFFLQENLIDWNENYRLKYSDFNGKVINYNKDKPEGKLVLKTTWTANKNDNEPPFFKIYNKFDKSNSSLSENHLDILNEYQFIWNLHELYIRKMRKEIQKLNDDRNTNLELYQNVINKNIKLFNKERKRYEGILQNQPHFFKILNEDYKDSLFIYQDYR